MFEIDHFFIGVPAPEGGLSAFERAGLTPGTPRLHPGQGTKGSFVFFDNAYVELLSRTDEADLRSDLVKPLGLWERIHWRDTGACPYGICLHAPADSFVGLETWPYAAKYLPEGAALPIVTAPGSFQEPMVFLSRRSARPADFVAGRKIPLEHGGKRHAVTRLVLDLPDGAVLSETLRDVLARAPIEVRTGPVYHLEFALDGGAGEAVDFRPALPLSMRR